MENNQLIEIKERLAKAAPGPWSYKKQAYGSTEMTDSTGDPIFYIDNSGGIEMFTQEAEFVSNSPSDIEFLLETTEKMKGALEFYADETNYVSVEGEFVSKVDEDNGTIADEALNLLRK